MLPTVRAEGLPPLPAALADALLPYASSRRALRLGWHPRERRLLIWTTFGNVGQIHAVAGPGMARRQLTFFKDGVPPPKPLAAGAWFDPQGTSFVFAKDTGGGAETTQLFRYDLATRQSTRLTDGASRNGLPVRAHRSGRIAYDSTRRGGHNGADRDLYVMDPADPASARMVAELDGTWSAEAWAPDDGNTGEPRTGAGGAASVAHRRRDRPADAADRSRRVRGVAAAPVFS